MTIKVSTFEYNYKGVKPFKEIRTTETREMRYEREGWRVRLEWQQVTSEWEGVSAKDSPEVRNPTILIWVKDLSTEDAYHMSLEYKAFTEYSAYYVRKEAANGSRRELGQKERETLRAKFDRVVWNYFTSDEGQRDLMTQTLAECQKTADELIAQMALNTRQVEMIARELAEMGLKAVDEK